MTLLVGEIDVNPTVSQLILTLLLLFFTHAGAMRPLCSVGREIEQCPVSKIAFTYS